ncbi:MAG: hypothetical protein GXO37_02105 [Chloroflexi bacterium]|nr:hypothetical protein [Chloroflexota bacterium]
MKGLTARLRYLFGSSKGLALGTVALIALTAAFMGMLSGPMAEWGVRDFWIRLWGMDLNPLEREGRLIFLYHAFAMAVIAVEVYMLTGLYAMKESYKLIIHILITVGYLSAMLFGLIFAYWGHNWVFHGLFIFGQALIFFAGVMLAVAFWPWSKDYRLPEGSPYWRLKGGVDGERLAVFIMVVATLISAIYGAVPGSFYGHGFEVFLSEDIIRIPYHTPLQLAIVGHLHIMLVDIAVAAVFIVSRWVDFKGWTQKWAMPLNIIGTVIISIGAWLVVPMRPIAHHVINVGASFLMLASVFMAIYVWRRQIEKGLAEMGLSYQEARFGQKLRALFRDPLPWGATWLMLFMNLVVTAPGVYMAIKLEMFRHWLLREEKIGLVGHWHILAFVIAAILLLYYIDLAGVRGKARQWLGWIVILGNMVATTGANVLILKRVFVPEILEQPLVSRTLLVMDIALFSFLTALAAFLMWRLVDLFKPDGRWVEEWRNPAFTPLYEEDTP